MKNCVILMLISVFCIIPIWVDGQTTTYPNAQAQAFMDAVTVPPAGSTQSFADATLSNIEGLNKTDYVNELGSIASQVTATANTSNFAPADYISQVKTQIATMLSDLQGFESAGKQMGAYTRDNYLKEAANIFIKEYVKDMKNGIVGIDTAAYIADFTRLNSYYTQQIEMLNNTSTSTPVSSTVFNPVDCLDKAAGSVVQKRSAKFEIDWLGVNDHWGGVRLGLILQSFIERFGTNSQAKSDLEYLQKIWAPSAEVYLMDAAYKTNPYPDPTWCSTHYTNDNCSYWQAKQSGAFANDSYINEYGMPMSYTNSGTNNFYDQQFNASAGNSTTVTDTYQYFPAPVTSHGTYNNRSWNYRYNAGANASTYIYNPTIKITTNGHEYVLQEGLYTSPIVLDLDGDGQLEASNGKWLPHAYDKGRLVEFDMDGDGFTDITEWVGPNEGLLLTNDRREEINANHLFGNAGGFSNGYEKLSLLDQDHDGKLTGEELKTLSVWQDRNSNAKADTGEISTLAQLGITAIQLNHQQLVSSFEQNGVMKKMWDWYPLVMVVKRKR